MDGSIKRLIAIQWENIAKIVACKHLFLTLFQLPDGSTLAALSWGKKSNKTSSSSFPYRLLCIHGWLDNAASFHLLAPALAASISGLHIVAIDLPGHGRSPPLASVADSQLLQFLAAVHGAIEALGWDTAKKFSLLGHSMGAKLALMYASSFSQHVERIILIEGPVWVDPFNEPDVPLPERNRFYLLRRLKALQQKKQEQPTSFDSTDQLLAVRQRAALTPTAPEAIKALVDRRGIRAPDPNLIWPFYHISPQQGEEYMRATSVTIPRLLIVGTHFFRMFRINRDHLIQALQPHKRVCIPGGHHLHAEDATAPQVIGEVIRFWKEFPAIQQAESVYSVNARRSRL